MLTKDKIKNEGIDPKYYEVLAKIESSNNPNAKAKTSSAAGLYQFTEGTWKEMVKNLGLNYTLDDRYNPQKSRKVVEAFTKRNAKYLESKLKRKPTENELYLAHFLGIGGAKKFIEAYTQFPDTDVRNIMSEKVINANKNVFLNKDGSYKKLRDVYNWSEEKMGVTGFQAPKDEAVYTFDENNQVININPELATQEQLELSDTVKALLAQKQFLNVTEEDEQENLTNLSDTQESSIFEPLPEDYKIPQWKKALDKKQQERNAILNYLTQEGLDYKSPEYKTVTPQLVKQQQFQEGGEIPTSPNGLYDHPKKPVIVPTKDGKITMKGIDYPVLGIADTGEEILMKPNQEYEFKGATQVLEIPQL